MQASTVIPRLARDMKFRIRIHIHIHKFYVDIYGYIHIHRFLLGTHVSTDCPQSTVDFYSLLVLKLYKSKNASCLWYFAVDCDLKFSTPKSAAMRVRPHFNLDCFIDVSWSKFDVPCDCEVSAHLSSSSIMF